MNADYQDLEIKKSVTLNPPQSPFFKGGSISPPFGKGRRGGILCPRIKELKCYISPKFRLCGHKSYHFLRLSAKICVPIN
ncbi:MAG: hypothetical protein A2Z51_08480 [Deltaproteobacteria bacterium RBG_19FT_COMBO_52_11]|nr:MAG: hypothetical protein A2Z51_08480 [Deltaproteobacteria bacterium RBG_19FT_COMBO_52_11]